MERILRVKTSLLHYLFPQVDSMNTLMPATTTMNGAHVQWLAKTRSVNGDRSRRDDVLNGRVQKQTTLKPRPRRRLSQSVSATSRDEQVFEDVVAAEKDGTESLGEEDPKDLVVSYNVKGDDEDIAEGEQVAIHVAENVFESADGDLDWNVIEEEEHVDEDGDEEDEEDEEEINLKPSEEASLKDDERALAGSHDDEKTRQDIAKLMAYAYEKGWHEDEIELCGRIYRRGTEPLLQITWQLDFQTVPDHLFSSNKEETYINCRGDSEFRAIRALGSLFGIGQQIRALEAVKGRVEPTMRRIVDSYIKWSERDGGYQHRTTIPMLHVVHLEEGQTTKELASAMQAQFELLALQWRRFLQIDEPFTKEDEADESKYRVNPPILYGMIILRSTIVFVSFDSSNAEAKQKTLMQFDMGEVGHDIWNAFAVAILVCNIRNKMMTWVEQWETDHEDEEDSDL